MVHASLLERKTDLLSFPPARRSIVILLAMTVGRTFLDPEHPAQALGWLDVLTELVPETVHLEVSSFLLIVLLVALSIWRSRPGEADRRSDRRAAGVSGRSLAERS